MKIRLVSMLNRSALRFWVQARPGATGCVYEIAFTFHCSNCERSAPVLAPGSSPRMKAFMQIFEMLACNMGIYLSRCNIDVPEHYLNSS